MSSSSHPQSALMASHSDTAERGKTTPSPGPASKGKLQDDRDPDDYLITWRYPPEFWDRLSEIPLVEDALEELDRRNRSSTSPSFPPRPTHPTWALSPQSVRAKIARFARHGGPDLTDLRGYRGPSNKAMSPSSRRRAAQRIDPSSSAPSPVRDPKSITPYHAACEQHFVDHDIHPRWSSQAPNLGELNSALRVPRPSLSSFSDRAFSVFAEADAQVKDEEDVKAHVLPTIMGATDQPSSINTLFGKLAPLTDGSLAGAKPDVYYGSLPKTLDRAVRDELSGHIVPSTMQDKPLAPNLFVEVKGPNGSNAVLQRQARYAGAIGARGMHTLRNYGKDEPVYDRTPYTFSSTYQAEAGHLRLYAHHVTEPAASGGRPEYHATLAGSYLLTESREAFVEGVTAFRNARDLAKQYREDFIRAANERARGEPGEENREEAMAVDDGGAPSPDQLVNVREEEPGPRPRPQQSFVGGVDAHTPSQDTQNGPRHRANTPAARSHGSRPKRRSRGLASSTSSRTPHCSGGGSQTQAGTPRLRGRKRIFT
ncbi:hypothetical protein MAPG_10979 [Magnaporthiopsis poae ATCC 64411]|uniref:DUF7924 domain-containing protein n=1 Tax=Magnaporthiopsis poae (strain ATCC 64411 / 73-15) TaxID=644358 RepID=A0A0C4EE15_MAGP6|nr:hypothetical protein MAPG_10979 [Magnaporthiopsis poae ATCC 64411]